MEQELIKAQLKFIKELEFYIEDPSRRSVDTIGGQCWYRFPSDTSKRCVIGRQIPDEKYYAKLERIGGVGNKEVLACLSPDIVKLGETFLAEVQFFHDNDANWFKEGLSWHGKDNLKQLIKDVKGGEYVNN